MDATKSEGQVEGILHASGILHDALIKQQSSALVREVYAPKVTGCQLLMQVSSMFPVMGSDRTMACMVSTFSSFIKLQARYRRADDILWGVCF